MATVPITTILAAMPSGDVEAPLDTAEMAQYLRDNLDTDSEKERNKRHALRDELFRDGGCRFMESVIDDVFADEQVKSLRKKWVRWSRFNNAIKRIVKELSSLYTDPAQRSVSGVADDVKYQEVLKLCRMDEQAIEINRLFNLHRALLVRPRVRVDEAGDRTLVLDIATPANVRAVLHPNDPTLVVGWLIRTQYRSARKPIASPAWTLWTRHEVVLLDDRFVAIAGTYKEHGFGLNPWVPITSHPAMPGFWPGEEGEDLVAATVAIWFTGVLMLKETKSATRQTVVQGDTTTAARNQAMESEVPIEMPDGTAITTVDMSTDVTIFSGTSDHVLERAGNNYGMSMAQMKHQGVQSADARELMRVPLRELRLEQQTPFRVFERDLALAMSAVLRVDWPEKAFSPEGWTIDFGEPQTPLSPKERLVIFAMARTEGLDNTIAYLMRLNPDLTEAQAKAIVEENIEVETWRNEKMRPLMQISGSLGAQTPNGQATPASTGDAAKGDDGLNGRNRVTPTPTGEET